MRKLFSFAFAAALAFGLASCSKDNTLVDGGNDGALAAVSFTFEKPKGNFATYADIASAKEWNIATLDVYAEVGGTATKLTETTHYTKVDGTREYTITMTADWVNANIGKSAKFYFVGNDASSTGGAHSSLSGAAIQDAMSSTLGQTLGKYNLIEADGATKNLLFSEEVVVSAIQGKVQATGQLKRRVARFDIENTVGTTLVIQKINVSNARANGLIFKNGTDAGAVLGSHVDIAGPTVYDATSKLAESVFYLYPTKLGDGSGTTTEIVLEATLNGTPQTFRVNSTENIVANKRYILTFDQTTLTFKLTVADWDADLNELPVEPGVEGAVTPGSFVATGDGTWNAATQTYTFTATTTNKLTFDVVTKYGTESSVAYVVGGTPSTDIAVNCVPTVTYSGYTTTDAYTINVPADAGDGFMIRVTIKAKQGEGSSTILFQKGTITVGDVIQNNPDLVTVIEDLLGKQPGDAITPEDLNSITTIDVSGENGANSLEGIENLPNLTEINANGNSNLTEVDLSSNPGLTNVDLGGTGISELNLSNNPNLEQIRAKGTNITKIDLTQSPKIKIINLSETLIEELDLSFCPDLSTAMLDNLPNLQSLDLSNQKNIYRFFISGGTSLKSVILPETIANNGESIGEASRFLLYKCPNLEIIENIENLQKFEEIRLDNLPSLVSPTALDFSSFTNLKKLYLLQSPFVSADISNSINLNYLNLSKMPNSVIVYVWNGFKESDIASLNTTDSDITFESVQ